MDLRLLTIFLPVAFCQIKPDVYFDENNDRFDLTPLIKEGAYEQWGNVMDGVRRANGNNKVDAVSDATSKFMDALRVFQQNYNYKTPDQDETNPEGKMQLRRDLANYFYDATRRSDHINEDGDREVLMQHAVPIVMKVEGIMQMPRNNE